MGTSISVHCIFSCVFVITVFDSLLLDDSSETGSDIGQVEITADLQDKIEPFLQVRDYMAATFQFRKNMIFRTEPKCSIAEIIFEFPRLMDPQMVGIIYIKCKYVIASFCFGLDLDHS